MTNIMRISSTGQNTIRFNGRNPIRSQIPVQAGLLTPVFFSNFETALGSGSTAVTDGGRWASTPSTIGGYGHDIVPSTGLDFPSENVLKVNANYANSGFCLLQKSPLSTIEVGSTRYNRLYVRMTFPDELEGNGDHPWQDGNAVGDSNYIIGVHYGADVTGSVRDGQWQLGVIPISDSGSEFFDNGPWLAKGSTYRIEWAVERLTTTTYDMQIRVYDSASALRYTEENFPADFGGGNLGTNGPYDIKSGQVAAFGDYFNAGVNDFEITDTGSFGIFDNSTWWNAPPYNGIFVYGYQGCFAVCDNQGWIGPYGNVVGEV